MPSSVETIEFYAVMGSEPDQPQKCHEIFLQRDRADSFIFNGLLQAVAMHRDVALEEGDVLSMIMQRGSEDVMTTGSLVVNSASDRHVWDFRVEKRWAPKP
jgi:hypothetical protein